MGTTFSAVIQVLNVLGALGIFLYGMRIMSNAIQKRSGDRMRRILGYMTRNRVSGVATGFGVTAIIQSSSATSVLLVSLVNAGLVTLREAIGVIMGANIGTTVTAWIIAILGFKFRITSLALPAIAIALPMHFSKREDRREFADILLGFGLLFLGLGLMKEFVPDLKESEETMRLIAHFAGDPTYFTILLFVLVGTLVTVIVQSSSAAMAITITMAVKGWITFPVAAAIVLGENIGTTITAYLASLPMGLNAKRTARAHMLFNLIGVAWVLALFFPFLHVVENVIAGDKHLPDRLALFHTSFNIINTCILIWFVAHIERLVKWIMPGKEEDREWAERIPFVSATTPEAVESNLVTSRMVIGKMAEEVYSMLMRVMNAQTETADQFEKTAADLRQSENWADDMQERVSRFLTECMAESVSENQAHRLHAHQRIVGELESITDSCYNIIKLLEQKHRKGFAFHEEGTDSLIDYLSLVLDFLRYNTDYLTHTLDKYDMDEAYEMERQVNQRRKQLRKAARKQLASGAEVRGELTFIDIVRHIEHIGDYCLNISQAIRTFEESGSRESGTAVGVGQHMAVEGLEP